MSDLLVYEEVVWLGGIGQERDLKRITERFQRMLNFQIRLCCTAAVYVVQMTQEFEVSYYFRQTSCNHQIMRTSY